jgi:hypothetical protein
LDPNIGRANERTGKWSKDEDIQLNDAVQTHGDKDWVAVSALVPSRTRRQCHNRWHQVLDPSIDRANARTGTWSEDEDIKLKDAVQTHGYGGKDWVAISALVPGRTRTQCCSRWKDISDPNIDRVVRRTGKWTAAEDSELKDAVQAHGRKNWGAIAALVPGRTIVQCSSRWRKVLDTNIDGASGRTGKWTAAEDSKLQDAVQTYGGKNWSAIAALVPDRTIIQCSCRWYKVLDPSIRRESGRKGSWTAFEGSELKETVQTYSGKNLGAIAALVPDRTKSQ